MQVYAEVLHDLGHTQNALEIFHNASLQCTDANFFNSYGYFLGNIGTLDRIVFEYSMYLFAFVHHSQIHLLGSF